MLQRQLAEALRLNPAYPQTINTSSPHFTLIYGALLLVIVKNARRALQQTLPFSNR